MQYDFMAFVPDLSVTGTMFEDVDPAKEYEIPGTARFRGADQILTGPAPWQPPKVGKVTKTESVGVLASDEDEEEEKVSDEPPIMKR